MVTPQKEIWDEGAFPVMDPAIGDESEAECPGDAEPAIPPLDEIPEPDDMPLEDAAVSVSDLGEDEIHLDSAASIYYREMGRYRTLDAEQEIELGVEIRHMRTEIWKCLLLLPLTRLYILSRLRREGHDVPLALVSLEDAARIRSRARAHLERLERMADSAAGMFARMDTDEIWMNDTMRLLQHTVDAVCSRGGSQSRILRETQCRVQDALARLRRVKRTFVEANLRLVIAVARKYSSGPMALIDLVQEGNIGLMKAVDRFDPDRGYRFSTYAAWWIRHAVSRAAADKSRTVRLPVHFIEAYQQLLRVRKDLQVQLGREPTQDEIAAALGISRRKAERIQNYLQEGTLSLDRSVNHEDARSFLEMLEDPKTTGGLCERIIHEKEAELSIKALDEALSPMEREIIIMRFGLGDSETYTLKEIGHHFRLSRERIRQIQEHALCKMRQYFASQQML